MIKIENDAISCRHLVTNEHRWEKKFSPGNVCCFRCHSLRAMFRGDKAWTHSAFLSLSLSHLLIWLRKKCLMIFSKAVVSHMFDLIRGEREREKSKTSFSMRFFPLFTMISRLFSIWSAIMFRVRFTLLGTKYRSNSSIWRKKAVSRRRWRGREMLAVPLLWYSYLMIKNEDDQWWIRNTSRVIEEREEETIETKAFLFHISII